MIGGKSCARDAMFQDHSAWHCRTIFIQHSRWRKDGIITSNCIQLITILLVWRCTNLRPHLHCGVGLKTKFYLREILLKSRVRTNYSSCAGASKSSSCCRRLFVLTNAVDMFCLGVQNVLRLLTSLWMCKMSESLGSLDNGALPVSWWCFIQNDGCEDSLQSSQSRVWGALHG